MPRSSQFKTKEEYNKWMREYRKKNIKKMRLYQKEYNRMRRKKGLDHSAEKWNKNNPKKAKVRYLVAYAIRTGMLKRRLCVVCKSKKSQAHHEDYNKPLEVIWLCPVHHKEIHMKKRGCA